ncbi:hypothetical protein RYX36_019174 [Vicia faba]
MATKTSKPLASHPTYEEMIKEAIVLLKEKTGSSQSAIAKFIEEKHKQLPPSYASPIFPSGNGISHSNNPWPQPNVPALHLPGSNIQSSRLRSSLCARDMPLEDFNNMRQDFDGQQHILNDINCFSQPCLGAISVSRSGRSETLTPSNLEDLFSAEVSSSPWYSDPAAASVFSPTHKSASITQTTASIPTLHMYHLIVFTFIEPTHQTPFTIQSFSQSSSPNTSA